MRRLHRFFTVAQREPLLFQLADPSAIHASPSAEPVLNQQAEDVVARIMKIDLNDSTAQEQTKASVENLGVELQKEAARRREAAPCAGGRA